MKLSDIQAYIEEHPWLGKWVLNKYTITTVIFGVFFLFVGDQSLLKQFQRARQMHSLQQQIDQSRENIATYQRELDYLANPDSLERYAREQYHMHAPNEDVYIVK
ncbi:MAG: septum formation initiator family protein [Paludibacteraceae bacterium]|nr:septum formation initiator family protein [Paludibacteraceae bacterium]